MKFGNKNTSQYLSHERRTDARLAMDQDSSTLVELGLDEVYGWQKVSHDVRILGIVQLDLVADKSLFIQMRIE